MTTQSSVIASVIDTWKRFGVFDFVLPFLLVFAIIYAILERTDLFGEKTGKSVNAIIAFTIAMTTTLTGWFISFLTGFLPWVSVISIIIITGLMLVTIFAKDFNKLLDDPERQKWMIRIGAVIVVGSLVAVLLWLGSPIWGELNLETVLGALGLSVTDLWGLVFFAAFIIVLFAIGYNKES